MENDEEAVFLFGISLSTRPRWQQFFLCSSGFLFGYLANIVCEEYIYNRLQFSSRWYFAFIRAWIYAALTYFLKDFTPKILVNSWRTYIKYSAFLMAMHWLSKGSLAFLDYPAQLTFESIKVLLMMIPGFFTPAHRRKSPPDEDIFAVVLVVGQILFTLAEAQTSPTFVLIIYASMIIDWYLHESFIEMMIENTRITQMEILFATFFSFIGVMILTGEARKAWILCAQHPYVYGVLLLEVYATFVGQVSFLCLVALLGTPTTAKITTARRAVDMTRKIKTL